MAILLAFAMAATMVACGEKEEETTTLTGMVVSVDGTVIKLMEMDTANMGGGRGENSGDSQRPSMPANMEGFDPEQFGGTMPEGFDPENLPEGFEGFNPGDLSGELPEGETWPQGERPTMPENGEMPEGATMPENGGMGFGFGNFASDAETKEIDIGNAHISVEIDGGKASGTIEDIKAGSFVTLTLNGDGEVTNVLVSQSRFGGGNRRQES